MDHFFAVDGPLLTFLTKVGQLIMLTVIWAVCCIPIITIVASSNSFYYAIIKSVRREVGYPVREFFKNFKRTFKNGFVFNIVLLLWAFLLYINMDIAVKSSIQYIKVLYGVYLVLIALTVCWLVYLLPVLSRFEVKKLKMVKMSLTMMFLQPVKTIVLAVVPMALAWIMFFYIPAACVLFIPGFWVYASTYLMEPVLKKFMPEPDPENPQWFDE